MTLPEIKVKVFLSGAKPIEYKFQDTFQIGRDEKCEISIDEKIVSRFHLEVFYDADRWWVEDLHSMNGTYIEGKKIDRIPISPHLRLELGKNGPQVLFEVTDETSAKTKTEQFIPAETQDFERHLLTEDEQNIGERTRITRRILEKAQKQQKKKYINYILMMTVLFLAATCFAIYKHRQVKQHKMLAEQIFYEMKALELKLASLSENENLKKNKELNTIFTEFKSKHDTQKKNYNQLIDKLGIYSSGKEQIDDIILKIARIFGECELNVPEEFVKEIKAYIKKWRSTDRYKTAITRAIENNYIGYVAQELKNHDLPPQFLYLALQESDFDSTRCGPETRYGIAKGIWQFIPQTATAYGLQTGTYYRLKRYDIRDERHRFAKSTQAAARLLKDLYTKDTEGSGLLVIASYNWGIGNVRQLISQLAKNPAERNFWKLLLKFKDQIPPETYDYVFYIFSAAVIGENPRLFGFDFDNPLADFES